MLVGAGLFGRTLTKLHAIEIGFNRDGVVLFTVRQVDTRLAIHELKTQAAPID